MKGKINQNCIKTKIMNVNSLKHKKGVTLL